MTAQTRFLTFVASILLSSCSGEFLKDDERHLSVGDSVNIVRTFTIDKLQSHIIFQDGIITKQNELKPYRTSCIFEANDLGPTEYQPEEFTVKGIAYHEEMYSDTGAVVRYYIELQLMSAQQHKPRILTCQILGDTMQYHSFALPEIQQAAGSYFSF
jgi:hypothetical protein